MVFAVLKALKIFNSPNEILKRTEIIHIVILE